MPKVHFLGDVKIPRDMVDEWADYKAGTIHDMSENEAERWLRRGGCEILTTRQANVILKEEVKVEETKTPEPVKEPEPTKATVTPAVEAVKVVDISSPTVSGRR